jgi:hypothetical protein
MEAVAGVLFSLNPCLFFQQQKEFFITFAINYDVEEIVTAVFSAV